MGILGSSVIIISLLVLILAPVRCQEVGKQPRIYARHDLHLFYHLGERYCSSEGPLVNIFWRPCFCSVLPEDEREYSYVEGAENGPKNWGKIHKEWASCGNGEMQSPIDLTHQRVQEVNYLGRLKREYKPSNATMVNRGHDMMVIII